MVYEEKLIGTATTVIDLIVILNTEVPHEATIEVSASCYMSSVEVWYDEGTNTVILK